MDNNLSLKRSNEKTLFYLIIKNIILLKNLTNNSFAYGWLGNIFCIFKSLNNILFLIYTDKNKSIISYDLINYKKINHIKNAHNFQITNFQYFFDKINKTDLIISISDSNNNLKLWNVVNIKF